MGENSKRIFSLDYLRGLAALGVMLFHYHTWMFGREDSHSVATKLGMYGVEIFYILSGLTLYLVYKRSIYNSKIFLQDFFVKRLFRIFPLLWLTIILSIVVRRLTPDLLSIFCNVTGLFGIIERRSYIPQGAWSIGNELVFYVFFPFLLFLLTYQKKFFYLACLIFFGIFLYFSFSTLSTNDTIENQWLIYINPFNQAFYFIAGILLGYLFENINIETKYNVGILIASVIIFIAYPVHGNRIFLATGFTRILYSVLSIAICFSFYKNKIVFPSFVHNPLAKLGEMSYSLYLVHPIVYFAYKRVPIPKGIPYYAAVKITLLVLTIIFTFYLSGIIHKYFETYFIKKGKAFMSYLKKPVQVEA
ncbi:acyltransferase family protein [Mucilaginibacter lappiensis]|uniref:acyltransferase family protein n=1 Tax=Mucilaginibacter lappiensis TaxID=354630 RepID=UPI003D21B041